jgi:LCP family protein required for cell wall assembly
VLDPYPGDVTHPVPAGSSPSTSPVRHGRQKRVRPVAAAIKLLLAVVAVVGLSTTSIAAVAAWSTLSNVKAGIHLSHLIASAPVPGVGAIGGEVNLLLAGTDTRTGQAGFQDKANLAGSSGAGNNDVTMVLHISKDHTNATVVSIPRDLLTTIPACPRANGGTIGATSQAMFNSTLSRGGLACTVLTAESLTGLTIDYAAEISFDGVIGMSDAVGGVSVCIATPVHDVYEGLNLDAGQQTLVGATALAFVRSRHGVADGSDLGRISNQQIFLSALMRKISSGGVLNDPLVLFKLANTALKNMQFSDTLAQPTTMMAIAVALKGIPLSNIVFVQYPTKTNPAYPDRVVQEQPADTILGQALSSDRPIVLTGQLGRAAILAPQTSTPAPSATPTPSRSAKPTKGGVTSAPTVAATPTPTATPVALPSDVTGQTAAQETCTKGR